MKCNLEIILSPKLNPVNKLYTVELLGDKEQASTKKRSFSVEMWSSAELSQF